MRQKGANLLHCYLEKQVFSSRTKISNILCIISWKSRFSNDRPKRCKFVAFLSGKAGFLRTRQKGANLLHYYVEKQVFSWRAKISYILCIITWKSRFSHDVPKTLIFDVLKRGKAGFLMTRRKLKCTFDPLLRFVAGFLLTRQKLLYFMNYYVEKQVFSWRAKKVQICCLITCKSRFSHDAPKRCTFVALLRFEAGFLVRSQKLLHLMLDALLRAKTGFLMMRQKGANLLHYYVEKQVFSWRNRKQSVYLMHYYVSKQVFSWRAKNSYIWCIFTWKSRFSHDVTENKVYIWCIITFQSRFSRDAPKTFTFDALLLGKTGFLMMRQKGANLLHYYVEKQVFSWRDRKQSVYKMHYYVSKQVFSWRAKNSYISCIIT